MFRPDGQRALVTGGTSGIGEARSAAREPEGGHLSSTGELGGTSSRPYVRPRDIIGFKICRLLREARADGNQRSSAALVRVVQPEC